MCLKLITRPQLMVQLFADNFVVTATSFFNLSRTRCGLYLILILVARVHNHSQPRLRGAIFLQNNSIKLCAIFNIFVVFRRVDFQLNLTKKVLNKIISKNHRYIFNNDEVLLIMCLKLITRPQLMVLLFADNFVVTVTYFFNLLLRTRYSLQLILILVARAYNHNQPRFWGANNIKIIRIKIENFLEIFTSSEGSIFNPNGGSIFNPT